MEAFKKMSDRLIPALGLLSLFCLVLLIARLFVTGTFRFWFIPENLALAWLALFFGWLLLWGLSRWRWLSWQNILLSIAWLIFLPNSWYVLTDFLHVFSTGEISQLYDIVMVFTLVVVGFTLGFASLFIVHIEFLKRWSERTAYTLVGVILLLSSFGIHIGRDLRWNTWDVLANPGGLIVTVSDRIAAPLEHSRAVNVTVLFFAMLSIFYLAFWLATGPHKLKKR
jgi:uncharacterized membrane protein